VPQYTFSACQMASHVRQQSNTQIPRSAVHLQALLQAAANKPPCWSVCRQWCRTGACPRKGAVGCCPRFEGTVVICEARWAVQKRLCNAALTVIHSVCARWPSAMSLSLMSRSCRCAQYRSCLAYACQEHVPQNLLASSVFACSTSAV
jgi:hypothetical protein